MKRIIGFYLRPYYGRMAVGFLIKFLGAIMDLFIPWILAYVIDNVIPAGSLRLIFLWGGIMFVCSILAVSFNIIANRMASRVASDATLGATDRCIYQAVSDLQADSGHL